MVKPPERPSGDDLPEPGTLQTRAQFASALVHLKGNRSYREITEAADALTASSAVRASGVDGWRPEALARGTVSDWTTGRGLPTRSKFLTFLVVTGVPAAQMPAWLTAWEVLQHRRPDADPHETPSAPTPVTSQHRSRVIVAAAVTLAVLLLALVALESRVVGASPEPTTTPSAMMASCPFVADGMSTVQPSLTTEGIESGLAFCPVRINDGHLPITGPFSLAAQVIGPIEVRRRMLLINHGDPRTCDADGNPTPREGFLAGDATIGSPDGSWSYVDGLGYPEAVTITRHFQYLLGSPNSIQAIKDDERTWAAAHSGQDDGYPGIESLPADVTVLATFTVPAGVFPDAAPCHS